MRHKLILFLVLFSFACGEKSGFDNVEPGATVTVTEHDGSSTTGRLIEVTPENVVVEQLDGNERILHRAAVETIAITDAGAEEGDRTLPPDEWVEVTIPAGTELIVSLDTAVGSDVSRVEQSVEAHLANDVEIDGRPVLDEGAAFAGSVTGVQRPGKVKGRGRVTFRFDRLTVGDEIYDIRTAAVSRTSRGTKKDDALKVGLPAAGGAVIGGILGGGKGAAVGTAVGAGAGAAVVMSTRGDDVHLPAGTRVQVRLTEPLQIRIRA